MAQLSPNSMTRPDQSQALRLASSGAVNERSLMPATV